jgi:hypothetical protein
LGWGWGRGVWGIDRVGFVQAFAGYVVGIEEAAGEVGYCDVFDFGAFDVCEEDTGDAGESAVGCPGLPQEHLFIVNAKGAKRPWRNSGCTEDIA